MASRSHAGKYSILIWTRYIYGLGPCKAKFRRGRLLGMCYSLSTLCPRCYASCRRCLTKARICVLLLFIYLVFQPAMLASRILQWVDTHSFAGMSPHLASHLCRAGTTNVGVGYCNSEQNESIWVESSRAGTIEWKSTKTCSTSGTGVMPPTNLITPLCLCTIQRCTFIYVHSSG